MSYDQNEIDCRRPIVTFLVGFVVVGIFFGCMTIRDAAKGTTRVISDSTRKVTGALGPGGSGLKHLVAVIGMEAPPHANQRGFSMKFIRAYKEFLATQCQRLLLDEAMGELMKFPPRLASGQIDGYSLAMIGRPRGINFFVIGTLSDVRLESEKTGFWLWKDTRYKLRATLRLEIVDTTTGSKALDESFWEEMVVDGLKHEELEASGAIPLVEVEPILDILMQEAEQKSCDVLQAQPWRGFITEVEQIRFTLSAGRAAGLSEGALLEVFEKGRSVESKDGQRFLLPGEKIGEARIQSLFDSQAEAVLSQAVPVGVGAIVRLK